MRFIYTKTFVVFVSLLVAIFILLWMQRQGWLEPVTYVAAQIPRPISKIGSAIIRPIKRTVTLTYSLSSIVREHGQLTARVAELEQQVAQADELRLQNEQLRKEAGFAAQSSLNLVACTVLARDPGGVSDTMVINCGKNKGIKDGQAVISEGFMVAKILVAGDFSSTAQLLIHPRSSIDAKLSKTDAAGIVSGSFGSGLVFELLDQKATLDQGGLIVTAGIDGIIPKNLLIGEVGSRISKDTDLLKKAAVVSTASYRSVEFVFVAL